ncbi:DUF2461 domain-containing protein [Oceanibacterium hippocampi]|uniref:TIGR02453 family protein n=1 Tax=Oceanibacterium hippocampi TaxID=745714 RepID=A0A1Y5TAX6_9PROT|nr:DUF2461 domain-containing protein [Oceanibacterium hippocampi]SLN59912.1 hypothetical protein OCH7691_02640 [Oceanibacterium hippocampi]
MTDFPGFSPAFFAFFRELAAHNDRDWFNANKDRYKAEVVAPLSSFIEAMAPRLGAISAHFVADPRPNGGSMFRIYKDVRFSKDKRPYKEHGAVQFRHAAGKDAHAPGYYVHLAPDEIFFGGGIWLPPSPQLKAIREAIAKPDGGWDKVIGDRDFAKTFGGVHGDGLSRPPRDFDKDHPHIEDLKRKSFFGMRREAPDFALRPDFVEAVGATFRAATPLMRFLTRAVGQPF